MIITASQIQWTADCEKALDRGDKRGLKSIRKKQVRERGGGGGGGECVCVCVVYDQVSFFQIPRPHV